MNAHETEALLVQSPITAADGGFQSLMVSLQRKLDKRTGKIQLDGQDIERIGRYALEYGRGTWENRLTEIFGRHLGPELNRKPRRH